MNKKHRYLEGGKLNSCFGIRDASVTSHLTGPHYGDVLTIPERQVLKSGQKDKHKIT